MKRELITWTVFLVLLSVHQASHASDRSFRGPEAMDVGVRSCAMVVGDFNGDGRPDVAASSCDSNLVSVVLAGVTGFEPPALYEVGLGAFRIFAIDVDLDGDTDLVTLRNFDTSATLLLNSRNGTFTTICDLFVRFAPQDLAVADLDADQRPELVLAGTGSAVVLKLEVADPCAATVLAAIKFPGDLLAISVDDRDGDGANDITVVHQINDSFQVSRFLGDGAGGFTLSDAHGALYSGTPFAVRPFDTDGAGAGDFLVFRSDGVDVIDGSELTSQAIFAAFPGEALEGPLVTGDIDGDRDIDVAVVSRQGERRYMRLLLHRGGLSFEADAPLELPISSATSILVADFERDGKPDLVIGRSATASVRIRDAAADRAAFGVVVSLDAAPTQIEVGDFDGDATPDVVGLSGRSIVMIHGDPEGFRSTSIVSALPEIPGQFPGTWLAYDDLTALDFDGDGRLDLALSANPDHPPIGGVWGRAVMVFLDVDGRISGDFHVVVNRRPGYVSSADFDHDGRDDLILADRDSDEITILVGTMNRVGRLWPPIRVGAPQTAIEPYDLDGDREVDLIVGTTTNVQVLFGDGLGEFSRRIELEDVRSPRQFVVKELDGDGRLDLLIVEDRRVSFFTNIAGGGSARFASLDVESSLVRVEPFDYDADSTLNLVLALRSDSVLTVRNAFGGARVEERYFVGPVGASDIRLVDVDRNGILDICAVDTGLRRLVHLAGNEPAPREVFRRGDVDADGKVLIGDAILILNALFLGTTPPTCPDAADANDDGGINLSDPLRILLYLFSAGDPPPSPGSNSCGTDPTADTLDDCESPACFP